MSDHTTGPAKAIAEMTVVKSYTGAWAVDAQGILISAETAAEAVAIVQAALLGTIK